MKNYDPDFQEITTSDIGLALYLLGHNCWIFRVVHVHGKNIRNRFKLTFTGYKAQHHVKQYLAGPAEKIDYKQLLSLLRKLCTSTPVQKEEWEPVPGEVQHA